MMTLQTNDHELDIEDEEEEREYRFHELSPEAQEHAIGRIQEDQYYLDHEWWDYLYDRFWEVAEALGVSIRNKHAGLTYKGTDGKVYNRSPMPEITFSGFWSQGDGASFCGRWYPKESIGAYDRTKEAWADEKLLEIAKWLEGLAECLNPNHDGSVSIEQRGRGVHSGCMEFEFHIDEDVDWGSMEEFQVAVYRINYPDLPSDWEVEVINAMRSLADWMYEKLAEEYDFLMSDESIRDYIENNKEDQLYDVDGNEL